MAFGRGTMPARPLTRHTPRTITSAHDLRLELEKVRRQGMASAVDELEVGLAAIAAPVRGGGGDVVAALSISGPTLRMTAARITELEPVLIAEARALSARLGHSQKGVDAA
jgi:DNA-binding IclR family transcriptional regulator